MTKHATDKALICSRCACDPCLPWCPRAIKGEVIPWVHNPFDARIRDLVVEAKRRSAVDIERHKGTGGD